MKTDRPTSNSKARLLPIIQDQNFAAGLLLVAIAISAYALTRDLARPSNGVGPATLPEWLSLALGVSGAALLTAAIYKPGVRFERAMLRGPALIILAVLMFASTIRGVSFAGVSIPGLGLLFAGPVAIMISGYASPDVRFDQLLGLALGLTAFCMLLFGDLLNLPIPILPQPLVDLLPASWSAKADLRLSAAALGAAAVLILVAWPNSTRRSST
ncbi:tripartite tricarboxylate transporter TctB family protein [Mesorhizobium sp. CU2]|uniref:tripartite tricarboxylate transporter TctB family protein n=1 Tax=Mesorhizobium sp. CU2 TaxID=2589985 RepID=UPI00112942FC|nr:tripartite tricarboxylate transporter TctB family protein [Mesorhizobium sp. CU2]TPN81072.1 tripartite tricarboxylate transporter TctB family protein [Mesorhizobium sp. CU3]TPO09827.1 tripartite tricarboxylate transporter TctB family protein [Mesorhizobium sp. CU2]